MRDEDFDTAVVWAGECADLVRVVEPAAQIVRRISAGAEEHIADAAHMLPTHFSRG